MVKPSQPTALYRAYDGSGRLLYVGISLNVIVRVSQHRNAVWFRDVARIDVVWFPDRPTAEVAEIDAIKTENPSYNKTDNPKYKKPEWKCPPVTDNLGRRRRLLDFLENPHG